MKDPAFAMALLTQVRPVTRNDLVSKVAADWQELMIRQRTMRSSISRISEQWDLRFAANKHSTAPGSHTGSSLRSP